MDNRENKDEKSLFSQHSAKLPVIRRSLSEDEFRREYYVEPPAHDEVACAALHAYEENAKKYDKLTPKVTPVHIPKGERMSDYAAKFGCTVEDMKQHWRCV
jgi:hypothetical protein